MLMIVSAGAQELRLHFADIDVPAEAALLVYSSNRQGNVAAFGGEMRSNYFQDILPLAGFGKFTLLDQMNR